MRRYKVTEYTNTEATIQRVVEGTKETMEAYAALVLAHATSTTLAATLIARAEQSVKNLPLGAGITAVPSDAHCITIHRLSERAA
jgi:hypothetical protein